MPGCRSHIDARTDLKTDTLVVGLHVNHKEVTLADVNNKWLESTMGEPREDLAGPVLDTGLEKVVKREGSQKMMKFERQPWHVPCKDSCRIFGRTVGIHHNRFVKERDPADRMVFAPLSPVSTDDGSDTPLRSRGQPTFLPLGRVM